MAPNFKSLVAEADRQMARNNPSMPSKMGVGMGAGQGLANRSSRVSTQPVRMPPVLGSYKKGGKVNKTGVYKFHKGEKVIKAKK